MRSWLVEKASVHGGGGSVPAGVHRDTSFSGGSAGERVLSAAQVVGVAGLLGIQPVRPTAPASVTVTARKSDQVAVEAPEQNHYLLVRLARPGEMEPGGPEK
jgi:hypothetical protein